MDIWVSTRSISRGISNAPFAIFEQSSSAVTQLSPAREVAAGMGEGRLSRSSQAALAGPPSAYGRDPRSCRPNPVGTLSPPGRLSPDKGLKSCNNFLGKNILIGSGTIAPFPRLRRQVVLRPRSAEGY
jgi:hypothetical protein